MYPLRLAHPSLSESATSLIVILILVSSDDLIDFIEIVVRDLSALGLLRNRGRSGLCLFIKVLFFIELLLIDIFVIGWGFGLGFRDAVAGSFDGRSFLYWSWASFALLGGGCCFCYCCVSLCRLQVDVLEHIEMNAGGEI